MYYINLNEYFFYGKMFQNSKTREIIKQTNDKYKSKVK